MRKIIVFDNRVLKIIKALAPLIRRRFEIKFNLLGEFGRLEEPDAKKLENNLYEIRIKSKTSWRGFYSYLKNDKIIILHIFQKQSQKTPKFEIKTALERLKIYI